MGRAVVDVLPLSSIDWTAPNGNALTRSKEYISLKSEYWWEIVLFCRTNFSASFRLHHKGSIKQMLTKDVEGRVRETTAWIEDHLLTGVQKQSWGDKKETLIFFKVCPFLNGVSEVGADKGSKRDSAHWQQTALHGSPAHEPWNHNLSWSPTLSQLSHSGSPRETNF